MEATDEPAISVGVASDGTVSACTPDGTLVLELAGLERGRAEVVTTMQRDLASSPIELARYPLRSFLAQVLHARRSTSARRSIRRLWQSSVPKSVRRVHQVALAHFVSVNFAALVLLAHSWPELAPLLAG